METRLNLVSTKTTINLSVLDRIRVLLCRSITIETFIKTEFPTGRCGTAAVTYIDGVLPIEINTSDSPQEENVIEVFSGGN